MRNFDHVVDERLIGVIGNLIDGLTEGAGFLSTKAGRMVRVSVCGPGPPYVESLTETMLAWQF